MAKITVQLVRHIENQLVARNMNVNYAHTLGAVKRVIDHVIGLGGDLHHRSETTLELYTFTRRVEEDTNGEEIMLKEVVVFEATKLEIDGFFRYFNGKFNKKWMENYPNSSGHYFSGRSYARSGPTKPGNMTQEEYIEFLTQMAARARSRGM